MVSIGTPVAGWEDNILDTARQFMTGEVCFYRVVGGTDDLPEIGQPGTPGTVEIIWRGKARIQHLRAPRRDSTEYQASDSRSFRFQLDPQDNPPPLYAGTKARVISGGRDAQLEAYSYQVESAVNSTQMAVRTVELTADMRPMTWGWSVPDQLAPAVLDWGQGSTLSLTRSGNIVTATLDPTGITDSSLGMLAFPDERYRPATSGNLSYSIGGRLFLVVHSDFFGSDGIGVSPVEAGPYTGGTVQWIAAPEGA